MNAPSPVIVHHTVDGPVDAPVVVLSNSLGTDHTMWDPQVEALARTHRVVRYDTRGHGRSPAPDGPYSIDDLAADVLALLDRLGVERASFCGLSLGGMTGMALGRVAPERFDRFVLLCTAAKLGPPAAWRDRAALVRAKGTDAVTDGTVGRWFTPAFVQERPEVVEQFVTNLRACADEGYAACCEAIVGLDELDSLAAVTQPTLVIAGADDPATPPEHAEAIVERMPDARLAVVERAAHIANVERPDEVTALVVEHLGAAS
ncbi:MAG: 3-oxoadipate enol-lactonase [Actinomycetota bacterium]|nr:3-oxoadipate enol-lactonase [Actinomycetota bacterium]